MEVEKRFICKSVKPLKKSPPDSCVKSKTIAFDTFQSHLYFFWDSRPEAIAYVEEVLPTLIHPPTKPEDILTLYRNLKGQWLEFDFTTNTLSLCSTKNLKQ